MAQNCDRASEFVVASLERVGDNVLRWTSRGPDARRGLVGHRRRPGILCKGSLRRIGGSKNHGPVSVVGLLATKLGCPRYTSGLTEAADRDHGGLGGNQQVARNPGSRSALDPCILSVGARCSRHQRREPSRGDEPKLLFCWRQRVE